MSLKILVVEDNALHSEIIQFAIDEIGYQLIKVVSSAVACIKTLVTSTPDIILLDINIIGEMNGIELAGIIKKKHPNLPIVFISSLMDDKTLEQAINTNPEAYLFKPIDEKILHSTLKIAAFKKQASLPAKQIQKEVQDKIETLSNAFSLTSREQDFLIALTSGFSNKQVSENLHISLNTVKYHIKNLYLKLGVSNRTELCNLF